MCSAVTHKLNEVSQIPHWCAIELEYLHIAVVFIPQSCIASQHLRQDNHLHSIATPHATAVQNSVKWQQTSTSVAIIAAQFVYLAAEFKAHFVTDVRWQCQYAHHRSGVKQQEWLMHQQHVGDTCSSGSSLSPCISRSNSLTGASLMYSAPYSLSK